MPDKCIVSKYESEFSRFYKVPYVLATNSGTSALLAALLALQIDKRKSVLVPAFSWPQLLAVPRALGYKVDFIDVDLDARMETEKLESKIKKGVGAIIICHLFGNPSPASKYVQVARKYGVPIIEDCSQALTAKDQGLNVGTWGDFGFCSTGKHKLLSTGEGGLLWTMSPKLYERAYTYSQDSERGDHKWLQNNTLFNSLSLRLHPCGAKRGLKSLDGLDFRLRVKSAEYEEIRCILSGISDVRMFRSARGAKSVWNHCPLILPNRLKNILRPYLWDSRAAYLLSFSRSYPNATQLSEKLSYLKTEMAGKYEYLDTIKRVVFGK